MNRMQKVACFNLIVVVLAAGLSITTICVRYFVFGQAMQAAWEGIAFMAIASLTGISPFLFKTKNGKVDFDERDKDIQRKAYRIGYAVFWVLFVSATVLPVFMIGLNGMIPVRYLTGMVFGAFFVVVAVRAIVMLREPANG